ncbi:MAG: IS200/IS605 family transposase [Bacteroidales bacterium]|nr:IS200/IS605 family transposase [Bacteroidales bacterium]
MANTYSQLYIHLIFAVKYRDASLHQSWRPRLYQYIIGLVNRRGHKVYAIGGIYDHIHILVSISPAQSISDLVAEVKRQSTEWIKENKFVRTRFAWQEGFAAFSYGKSQVHNVVEYIQRQEEHHSKHKFRDEYLSFLRLFDVDYDDRYIFKELE